MRSSSGPQLILLASLSAALGCGGVTSAVLADAAAEAPPADAPPADAPAAEASPTEGRINEACAAVAKAACDKRVACSGTINPAGIGIIRGFGTMAACLTRQALQCVNAFRAPGSGHSLATEQLCVEAFATYTCTEFYADNVPAPCLPPGSRVNGAACAYDAQCRSSFCTGEKNALCGTCGTSPAVGASCASSECGRGQFCDGTTATCKLIGVAGDACDAADGCGFGLVCGGLATARTCQKTVSELGAACGGTMPVCDGSQGIFCAGVVGLKKCVAVSYVADGMPCGLLSQDSFAGCTAGACFTAKGLMGPGEMGTCKADAADGAACDTVLGPGCTLPARCILSGSGTAGTCRVPSGTCGAP